MKLQEYFVRPTNVAVRLWSTALVCGVTIACGEPRVATPPPDRTQAPVAGSGATTVPPSPSQVVAATTAPAPAASPANATELQLQLRKIFSGYEYVPTREDLLRLAAEPALVPALWTLYGDAHAPLAARTQSLVSLRFFPSDQTRAWLEQVLADATTPNTVRRPAAKAYGHAFGAAAVPVLTQLLAHPDLHTRDSAARALGAIAVPASKVALEARLSIEPEPSVKATLVAQLAKLGSAAGQP